MGGKAAPCRLGWQLGFSPQTKTEIESLFLFIKPFIFSNNFDSNSNLNVAAIYHPIENTKLAVLAARHRELCQAYKDNLDAICLQNLESASYTHLPQVSQARKHYSHLIVIDSNC
jgi:hypothetical protein